ncbi:response regulator receiver domain protein [Marvinbryantia formatexigens DSM 14469]|uniref:Stage 0 sporulation protein A homolog n=1 Tax=Marvinbryantia formatexigens DSM 14469 TaxID=478749 RepID=C6LCG6_9FIRM|nr:response regulator transcription factor [Marvinbryantia formatexigens]EET61630.1 response regulator receiver domain protein [Marvinbryantia formatexigens DSM 14469]UWO24545.1 response regulator transcription factor [Marvinbryantia formatexigens DSM 14469]SDF12623.1 two component transcriptional regulator, winged helix family [Marvinbryantia formatexigens]
MDQKLLVVEDDRRLQEIISDYFESKGWQVRVTDDGEEVLEKIQTNSYQLILLDVMLPGENGFTICRKIREISDVPVIFITARVQEEDELNGYAMGADDYVTKPFSLPVLYAKVTALIGRMHGSSAGRRIRAGDIEVDVRTHEVWSGEERCELPPKEYELLLFFLENPKRIFSREQLLIRFWGYDFDGNERVVDNHIKKLRKLLGKSGSMIRTIRKSGYRMEVIP